VIGDSGGQGGSIHECIRAGADAADAIAGGYLGVGGAVSAPAWTK
jgi:hypothetical protein